ncbi:MAG: M48 family metallopeptidase [Cytophagaceae bacterium]|nr:M48 family metallopeptidase [Cytophagaceae bacterium]
MKKVVLVSMVVGLTMIACSRVPISNRRQLLLVSDQELNAQALVSYRQFLDTNQVVSSGSSNTQMVRRVGERIARAATSYFNQNKMPEYLSGFKWEFNLIDNKQVNAWCMPGGKVVVYTGILPVTQSEAGLATVMGHEISHAIAKHGGERMSQGLVAQGLLVAGQAGLGVAMSSKRQETQQLWNNVFGLAAPIGAQVALLKYGRDQESEADHLGVIFMAMAGYNPEESIKFWSRMAQAGGKGQKPPQFLSTHPADDKRIRDLQRLMPEARKYYTRSGGTSASR